MQKAGCRLVLAPPVMQTHRLAQCPRLAGRASLLQTPCFVRCSPATADQPITPAPPPQPEERGAKEQCAGYRGALREGKAPGDRKIRSSIHQNSRCRGRKLKLMRARSFK